MQLLNGKDVAAFHGKRIAQQIQDVREKKGIDPNLPSSSSVTMRRRLCMRRP